MSYNICNNCGCAVRNGDSLCPACGELVLQPMPIEAWLSSENYTIQGNNLSDHYMKIAEQMFNEAQESDEKRNQAMVMNFALNYGGADFDDLEEFMEKEELLQQNMEKYGW